MSKIEIEGGMNKLMEKYTIKVKELDLRKQANAITASCFRNTILKDYHASGFISDAEMKNVNIETPDEQELLT